MKVTSVKVTALNNYFLNTLDKIQAVNERFEKEYIKIAAQNKEDSQIQLDLVVRRWSQMILSLGGFPLNSFTAKYVWKRDKNTYLISSTSSKIM